MIKLRMLISTFTLLIAVSVSATAQHERIEGYQFKGRLLRSKPDGPSFSGWLSKIVNGSKAAEAQVEFDLIEGVD